jgi:hypothetical protein
MVIRVNTVVRLIKVIRVIKVIRIVRVIWVIRVMTKQPITRRLLVEKWRQEGMERRVVRMGRRGVRKRRKEG